MEALTEQERIIFTKLVKLARTNPGRFFSIQELGFDKSSLLGLADRKVIHSRIDPMQRVWRFRAPQPKGK